MRILIAEDHVLLREGMCRLLGERGHEVVAQIGDASRFADEVGRHRPDLAIVDVRMPPTLTDDGLRAALAVRKQTPGLAILVLSQYVEVGHARALLSTGDGGVGYLLKDRVSSTSDFLDAVARVAAGEVLVDPSLVRQFLAPGRAVSGLDVLSTRETEVLALMAQGQSNAAIAGAMFVTESAVEKHIGRIFTKLGLTDPVKQNRRTMAVLTYLRETGQVQAP